MEDGLGTDAALRHPRVTRAELEGVVMPPQDDAPQPARAHYQEWLDEIDDGLVSAALLVGEALPDVNRAFLAADRGGIDHARILSDDVARRVRHVEEQGFLLLARESPVAGDLRRLVAILRLVTAVERPASLLAHVASTVERFDPRSLPADVRARAEDLGERATDVYRRGIDAWRTHDGLAIHELDQADDAVDQLSHGLLAHAQEVTGIAEVLGLGVIARCWERIADHGVSFAQHSTFAITGVRVEA